ncbi:MAG: twin-arginine translocation signal domain-containing protein [Armatimonadetes bacterium]|nr:twin-arginine translocation signal domain-containing protein [Armatimonadota bacterium]
MKKKDENKEQGHEVLTRRAAMKRIAAAMGGAALGVGMFGQAPEAWGQYSSSRQIARYISIEGSYVDTVYVDNKYVNRGPSYKDYVSFYKSYSSHRPPPPPGKK